jgi:uncharacterized membrane protein YfcA
MPVYLVAGRSGLLAIWPLILIATVGVVIGTLVGTPMLTRVPERQFRRIVAILLLALGGWMLSGRAV